MDAIEKKLLEEVADLHGIPEGAYNIRADGKLAGRNTTAHINIVTKEDKPGIDIYIAPGTKNESVHIPVIISQTGLKDMVYNDFYVGEDCDVTIVAAAASTTAARRSPATTASTASLSARTPRCATSKSTMARATATARMS